MDSNCIGQLLQHSSTGTYVSVGMCVPAQVCMSTFPYLHVAAFVCYGCGWMVRSTTRPLILVWGEQNIQKQLGVVNQDDNILKAK